MNTPASASVGRASEHDWTSLAMREDDALRAMLVAGRKYAVARRDTELAATFFETIRSFVPDGAVVLHLRDPIGGRVHSFVSSSSESVAREPRVPRSLVASLSVDLSGFSIVDDAAVRPDEFDAVAVASGSLLVAIHASIGEAPDRARVEHRLERFVEQLADAVVELAERSETARLRLYAGSIVDRTNVPIAVVDHDGHVRLSNAALRAALSVDPRSVATDRLLDRIDPLDRHRAIAAHVRAFRGRSIGGVELRIRDEDDGERRMLVDFEPIPLPTGDVDSVLVVAKDVTRVRQLEDQVSHADRLATLGQLAAGVVHELNNPLTSILVYTEYVLRRAEQRGPDDADAEKLRRVLHAAERIQDFARNLVAYSRAERGEREFLRTDEVLEQAVSFCEPILDKKRVRLTRHYDDGLPELPAVRGQLQQIFINLLTNAVHAVAEGTGAIDVHLGRGAPGFLEVRFDDNGPGISPERREDVFRPFVTTKPTGEGTGLGLSIVRNLVERHAGEITITDSPLGGARFVVSFPMKPTSVRPPPPPGPETE